MTHGNRIRKPDDRDTTRMVIDSELFDDLQFEIKKNHLIIFGGKNGTMSVHLKSLPMFVKEITEIIDVYGGDFI